MTRSGRVTVLAAGVLLLATACIALVRASAEGVWSLAVLVAVAVAVVALPLASSSATHPPARKPDS